MPVRLVRGRSKQSHLVLAGRNVHVFVFAPKTDADSFGVTVRWRRPGRWWHVRIVLLQRNASKGRGSLRQGERFLIRPTLTLFEGATWATVGANGQGERIGTKGYVRVKAAWPGRSA